ncbi:uncharacterized protein LOC122072239 [Macadamia integrifolia]|uniref:uncharacterized protein LOC122072239 n=1 Tax=Macadamia integrifolia TaxID=60698 RepID=UPI001C4FF9F2|nr:uncharacterized protein LOC122072239 [Macadamia integrifolia]
MVQEMRGVGGPLLSIGDLLSDVGDEASVGENLETSSLTSSPSSSTVNATLPPSNLSQLFKENYNQLNEALSGTDHSWTALTLKLCTSLETADKLIQSANSNIRVLSEKVEALESIMKRGDSAVAAVKGVDVTQLKKERSPTGS